jgi:hypothetical protein
MEDVRLRPEAGKEKKRARKMRGAGKTQERGTTYICTENG